MNSFITSNINQLGNLYIADTGNHRVRKVTVSTGIITLIAGNGGTGSYSGDNGQATSAALYSPTAISVDSAGKRFNKILLTMPHLWPYPYLGNVYIADCYNHRIRKVTVSTGIITTIAGTGSTTYNGDGGAATSATLYWPYGINIDSTGKT